MPDNRSTDNLNPTYILRHANLSNFYILRDTPDLAMQPPEQLTEQATEQARDPNMVRCRHCYNHYEMGKTKTIDGYYYCMDCYNSLYTECETCKKVHYYLDFTTIIKDKKEIRLCVNCANKNSSKCFNCGYRWHNDNLKLDTNINEKICHACIGKIKTGKAKGYLYYGGKRVDLQVFNTDLKCNDFRYPFLTGVEIEIEKNAEFTRLNEDIIKVNNNIGYKVTSDGSLQNGLEIVTNPANNAELARVLRDTTKVLQKNNACIRSTCGLHVHINAGQWSQLEIKKIARFYMLFEKDIFAMLPRSRRANRYCKALTIAENIKEFYSRKHLDNAVYPKITDKGYCKKDRYNQARYFALNLHSYFYRGTLEFRHHSGTLNYIKIKNWINIIHTICDKALKISDGNLKKLRENTELKNRYFKAEILQDLSEYYDKRCSKFLEVDTESENYDIDAVGDQELENLF